MTLPTWLRTFLLKLTLKPSNAEWQWIAELADTHGRPAVEEARYRLTDRALLAVRELWFYRDLCHDALRLTGYLRELIETKEITNADWTEAIILGMCSRLEHRAGESYKERAQREGARLFDRRLSGVPGDAPDAPPNEIESIPNADAIALISIFARVCDQARREAADPDKGRKGQPVFPMKTLETYQLACERWLRQAGVAGGSTVGEEELEELPE